MNRDPDPDPIESANNVHVDPDPDPDLEIKIREAIRWGRRAVDAILDEVETETDLVHHDRTLRATVDFVQTALARLEAEASASSVEGRPFQLSSLTSRFIFLNFEN